MAKKQKNAVENQTVYQHTRGIVKDNAIMALLHDKLFRQRIEKKRKGKGCYQRKAKHAGKMFEKPDDKLFTNRNFIIGFFFCLKTYIFQKYLRYHSKFLNIHTYILLHQQNQHRTSVI